MPTRRGTFTTSLSDAERRAEITAFRIAKKASLAEAARRDEERDYGNDSLVGKMVMSAEECAKLDMTEPKRMKGDNWARDGKVHEYNGDSGVLNAARCTICEVREKDCIILLEEGQDPCQHSFCYHCVEEWMKNTNKKYDEEKDKVVKYKTFTCPTCRKPTVRKPPFYFMVDFNPSLMR